MTATTLTTTPARTRRSALSAPLRAPLVRSTTLATLAAMLLTEVLTALVRAAGVHLELGTPSGKGGTPLGVGACTIGIALCMIPGAALIALARYRATRPARTFAIGAVLLTVISLAAPLAEPSTSTGTRITLVAAHLIAAALIVPAAARRLPATR